MKKSLTCILLFVSCMVFTACKDNQSNEGIDLVMAKKEIERLDKQFSQLYYAGDSIGLYDMYAEGAYFGTSQGEEILSAWSVQIKSAFENDLRSFTFNTSSLSTDNEFLFERGTWAIKNSASELKYEGKYLLVWKWEDEQWKIYRDMGL